MFADSQAVLESTNRRVFDTSSRYFIAVPANALWSSTLLLPIVATLVSLVVLVAHAAYSRFHKSAAQGYIQLQPQQSSPSYGSYLKGRVDQLGGPTIFFLNVIRFLSCITLLGLNICTVSSVHDLHHRTWLQYGLCATYCYTSLLAIWALTSNIFWRRIVIGHLAIVLLLTWAVFMYRDIWPLGTYTLQPMDAIEGKILWAKIGLLTVGAVIVPLVIPRQYIPYNPEDPFAEVNPEQTASLLSLISYTYMDSVIGSASRGNHLPLEKLPPLCDYDAMRNLVDHKYKNVDTVQAYPDRHFFWKLSRVFLSEYVEMAVMLSLEVLTSFLAPIGLNRILAHLESRGSPATIRPWVWILLLILGPSSLAVVSQRYLFVTYRAVARMQGIVTQVVFDHALRIRLKAEASESDDKDLTTTYSPDLGFVVDEEETSTLAEDQRSSEGQDKSTDGREANSRASSASVASESRDSNMIGKINNLVTTDLNAIEGGRGLLLVVFYTPLQIAMSVAFLYVILGWSAFVGIGFMIALLFLPGVVTKLSHGVQVEKMKKSDARVQTVTETMSGAIRTVKLFGWERKISARIDQQRQEELKAVRKAKLLWLGSCVLTNLIPVVTMVIMFATYTLIMKQELTASKIFSSMAVFGTLQDHFFGCAYQIPVLIQAKIALDRINDFLFKTELLDAFTNKAEITSTRLASNPSDLIGIRAASFTWDGNNDGTETPSPNKRSFKLCINDELIFKRGHINLIIGQTGSGKTSLLMALLGEMHYIPMGPGSMVSLPRGDGVAYHAQESWIMNETIRNNILFDSPYDEERYKKVIKQCALERDLSLFDAGDETEVGEKGITLSGGQKARITLARAVYSQAAILLLDDVLAALDVHTAQWIVENCLKGDLVQGRTVILVTHNVALASPIAEFVICLSPDGRVLSTGSLSNALAKEKKLSAEAAQEIEQLQQVEKETFSTDTVVTTQQTSGKLVVAEEISVGHVSWTALKLLFGNTGSGIGLFLFWVMYVGMLFASQIGVVVDSWILALWAREYDTQDPSEVSVTHYLSLYITIVAASTLAVAISNIVLTVGTLRASRIIHRTLIDSILRATLRWLDTTPSSRIIARCTQDIAAIDTNVVALLNSVVHMSFELLLKFLAVVVLSPVFTIPGILVGILGGWLGQVYIKAQLAVKREMSNTKSPVLGHFGAAISGLVSIRAYGAQDVFRRESLVRLDRCTRATRTYWNLSRWVAIRAELLSAFFSTALAAYLVYGQYSDAASTGYSLSMAVSFSSMILMCIGNFNEFELQGNSLERIHQYLLIDQEPKPTAEGVPSASWPASGELRVENLSARYSADGPKVLHDISFHVAPGERVGIVGRTGSGKSSLTLALLRGIFTEGKVYYDGLATDTINLDALRSHITVIPQVPELLTGTLRENVDPFAQYEDVVLNDALRAAGLFSLQSATDEGRLTLDSAISNGGGNLSIGQRQIITLARAIVRQSKLLILDEATSAIDYETDSVIQESLRKEVANDTTLLIIAHRLQTIMDSDKILVLDAGRIAEYGKPIELLQNEDGFLRSLVDASGDKEKLYTMAANGLTTVRM